MELMAGTVRQVRLFLLLISLTILLLTFASLYFDLRGSDQQYAALAVDVARSFYQAIEAVRDVNLTRGGIYIREVPGAAPDPLLARPLGEIIVDDGIKMALISHASMTRLLSDVLTQNRGIQLHITSLTPIRPENRPEDWEANALRSFEAGTRQEYYDLAGTGEREMFRFMAPVKTRESCFSCHDGHQAGQRIRGGISVSFAYRPFQKIRGIQNRRTVAAHLIIAFAGLAFAGLMGNRLLKSMRALQDSTDRIKRLEGLLPICSRCKKIRLEGADQRLQSSWIAVERYIEERTDAEFTHGMCPECAKSLYPQFFKDEGKDARTGA